MKTLSKFSASKKIKALLLALVATCAVGAAIGCTDAGDLLDLALDPPSRHPIDQTKVGVNNFFVNNEFGSIDAQYKDISQTLGVKYVRVLFAWTDAVQPSPSSSVNLDFFDRILNQAPSNVDILIAVAHTPSWMANSANWETGNPRTEWVTRWFEPLVRRYAGHPRVIGWEVWNEPDLTVVASDSALELTEPNNYLQLLAQASNVIHADDPGKLVVMAASSSINQGFPKAFNYNKALRDGGVENYIDVYNVHYYGTNYESVVSNGGIGDFLNGINKPIYITESGEQGPNNQLAYVEKTWPFLTDHIGSIQRFYYFEYGSTAPTEQNFGLRTTDPNFPVSDLYINLRDN